MASLLIARKGLSALVVLSNMFIEGILLAEALSALVAAESLGTFVHGLMSFQSGACDEALAAAFSRAHVLALMRMDSLDVLFEMLVYCIVLVAALVRAFEGARVCVRIEVISEASRSVKGFGAAGPCAG
jgi:hypothetical protein